MNHTLPSQQQIVVVGNGMVGHKFVESLVEAIAGSETDHGIKITVLGEEPRGAYDRVQLSKYFSGTTAEELSLIKPGFYEDNAIDLRLSACVSRIDSAQSQVTLKSGEIVPYDQLVLATGSYPFVPPFPGHDREGCFVYRTIEDLDATISASKGKKVGVVVGGGLLGLEAAKALKDLGLDTHVVEFAPQLMAVQLDRQGGTLLQQKIEALGVAVHTSKNTKEVVDGEECAQRIIFADGSHLETDIILFSAGIRPRDELAKQFGIEVGQRGGIVVDNQCRTSLPNIYAIGECALWNNQIFGLVAPGYQMAEVLANHLLGIESSFTGADMSTKLKLLGVDVASIGDAHGKSAGAKSYTWLDEDAQTYKKIVVSQDKKHLLGAILVGDAESYGTLLQYMLNAIELPKNPEQLILPSFGDAPLGLGVDALPATAQICSCHNVTKADICGAIEGGQTELSGLKSCTKAGTGCGGCTALLGQVLNNELEKLGLEVNRDLCEHFPHTRQELYHLVRVGNIRRFEDLIAKHGRGRGCDICKPTVGSIFASCWNEHVLEKEHAGLQDTNDYFLGNLQKNGTYSVVPRIAGGEITPEKLIVLGEIGRDFNLYTKITGGQRVDLFGAKLNDLPQIWKLLIDAGFETGHAYGKSMRTVKSCVGSTWCRYGVLDSVGMAIRIENRYKGIRSPHKFKLAVSGCTRECAEAQSKDVGVIATENGWNLYVSGNGGMKPRHADLLATGLDDETLFKYIDRYLMLYIKTADRLQRTSTWLDNLEGGLDYVKDVVCNDSLGIAAELESQMQYLVDQYQCEWKTTIEDSEKLKRFRHFVNSEQHDEEVLFVEERGQIRPASNEERILARSA
ncbi:nitrite reductase large subunit NirB [Allohahella marinimesophila]